MPKISTQGNGQVYGTPDKATINISVRTVKPTATEARETHGPIVQKLNAAVVAAGAEAKDIQSSSFQFGQNLEYNRKTNESEPKGFFASNSISVRIRDLKRVSDLLDGCVKGGATKIDGPNLAIENPRVLEDQARQLAFEDAKKKAELYCQLAGMKLGDVVDITEQTNHYRPRATAGKAALALEGDEDELMVGQLEISITVNVVWDAMP